MSWRQQVNLKRRYIFATAQRHISVGHDINKHVCENITPHAIYAFYWQSWSAVVVILVTGHGCQFDNRRDFLVSEHKLKNLTTIKGCVNKEGGGIVHFILTHIGRLFGFYDIISCKTGVKALMTQSCQPYKLHDLNNELEKANFLKPKK